MFSLRTLSPSAGGPNQVPVLYLRGIGWAGQAPVRNHIPTREAQKLVMTRFNPHLLCAITLMVFSTFGHAAEISVQQAEALMLHCQLQREQQIKPLRQQAIEHCIQQQTGDRVHCERLHRAYGAHSASDDGPELFWDIPICEIAIAAERFFKANPGKYVYVRDPV